MTESITANPVRNDTSDNPTSPLAQQHCLLCPKPRRSGRGRFCSDACRQRGFRRRQRPPDEIYLGLITRLPTTSIIYQCPECDARLLGQQRCDDCGVFARRLGPGGACPHCDEAVAIVDLIAELRSGLPTTMPTTEVTPNTTPR